MAHTAAHVPNLAFTEERSKRNRAIVGGEKVLNVFIIVWLRKPLKAV